MKLILLFTFLLVCVVSLAQETPYQSFEVDSAAEPRGGMAYLTTFVQANLRKPITAEAEGLSGLVVVKGTVEADGHIANVTVLRGLRPDCNREAMRVFKLYNAWKPAQKGGKAVRQAVTYPVRFAPNTPFLYVNGAHVSFFDATQKPVIDSSLAAFKQTMPLDSMGLPAGDIVLYRKQTKKWLEETRTPLVRKKNEYHHLPGGPDYFVGYPNSIIRYSGLLAGFDANGALVQRVYFQDRKPIGADEYYYPNGVLSEKVEENDDQTLYTSWYPNGQMAQIKIQSKEKSKSSSGSYTTIEKVTALWDSVGHQNVNDGNGQATYQTKEISKIDTSRTTLFVEKGSYKNGLKQGIWLGRYTDGSYMYEELYENGICQTGKSTSTTGDTLRYTIVNQEPEFSGGMEGLGKFLSQNLQYPTNAQRAGVQGRVFISFVVCTDGSLCDYEVLQGVQPEIDKEAVRVVQKMSGRWKPGVRRGQKVRVKYNLPITFSLY